MESRGKWLFYANVIMFLLPSFYSARTRQFYSNFYYCRDNPKDIVHIKKRGNGRYKWCDCCFQRFKLYFFSLNGGKENKKMQKGPTKLIEFFSDSSSRSLCKWIGGSSPLLWFCAICWRHLTLDQEIRGRAWKSYFSCSIAHHRLWKLIMKN